MRLIRFYLLPTLSTKSFLLSLLALPTAQMISDMSLFDLCVFSCLLKGQTFDVRLRLNSRWLAMMVKGGKTCRLKWDFLVFCLRLWCWTRLIHPWICISSRSEGGITKNNHASSSAWFMAFYEMSCDLNLPSCLKCFFGVRKMLIKLFICFSINFKLFHFTTSHVKRFFNARSTGNAWTCKICVGLGGEKFVEGGTTINWSLVLARKKNWIHARSNALI